MTRLAECSADTSSSWQRACSRVPRSSPSGAARTVRSPPSPGTAYTRFLPTRTRSAPTSTRSRDRVAWVTSMPSPARWSSSSVCERTGVEARISTIRCWRAAREVETVIAPPPALVLLDEPRQQRLLRVQAVLGLLPDQGCRAVDHLGVDLEAAVGRQAVEEHGIRGRLRHQRRGDPERARTGWRRPCAPRPRPPGPSRPRCRWRRRRRRPPRRPGRR